MSEESGSNTVESNALGEDSIIKEQSTTIKTLTDQISKTETGKAQQVFMPAANGKTPNYAMILLIGVAIFFFFKVKM